MKIIMEQYGRFLLEGLVMLLLVFLFFIGIRDDAGNQGVPAIVGAVVKEQTQGVDYGAYTDYDVYQAESTKAAPVIRYDASVNANVGMWKVSEHIKATDYAGGNLALKVAGILDPDGGDLTDTYNQADSEIFLTNPGIYVFTVYAVDAENRKTVSRIQIPVNR